MHQPTYAFNLRGGDLNRPCSWTCLGFDTSALLATHLGCRLRLSCCVVLVRELAVNINHLRASRDIELVLRSACGALNRSDTWTLGQGDLDGILTADRASEDCRQLLLHNPDDTPTSTTHANPTKRMGDPPLISTFHVSFAGESSKGYQDPMTRVPGIRNRIP